MTERTRNVAFYESPARITLIDGAQGPELGVAQTVMTLPVQFTTEDGHDVVQLPDGNLLVLP